MALMKEIRVGDSLKFECGSIDPEAIKDINIVLTAAEWGRARLKIKADRSIPIKHSKNNQDNRSPRG